MKIDFVTLSPYFFALVPLAVLFLAVAIDRRRRKRLEKPPQLEKLLRPPGYSLSIRLDEVFDKIIFESFMASGLAVFAGASAICVGLFWANHVSPVVLLVSVLIFAASAGLVVSAVLRAFRRVREAENIRLGLRGEQAVAEALGEAADSGFRAFHDLEDAKIGNIDHVAAGSRGVFLIETKARRRRLSRSGQPEHEVVFNGESLQFPSGINDAHSIQQAKINAKWLSNCLGKKTGEPVRVEPLVVLPGWFVRWPQKEIFQ